MVREKQKRIYNVKNTRPVKIHIYTVQDFAFMSEITNSSLFFLGHKRHPNYIDEFYPSNIRVSPKCRKPQANRPGNISRRRQKAECYEIIVNSRSYGAKKKRRLINRDTEET